MMTHSLVTIIALGCLAVLALDTIGSLAARRFKFDYRLFFVWSFFIYLFAARAAVEAGGTIAAAIACACIALVDSTIGWVISWRIGPGKPKKQVSRATILAAPVIVIFMATLLGLVTGVLSR
jgi:hypothetical protein